MSNVVFVPFPEAGHLYATFKLARQLKSLGHAVSYLGLRDFQSTISQQQFDFVPFLESQIPPGFLTTARRDGREALPAIMSALQSERAVEDILAEMDRVLTEVLPDVVIVDLLLPTIALAARARSASVVLLNTQFYDPWEDPRKAKIYSKLNDIPEIVLCPEEFDFPRPNKRGNCFFVEPSIDQDRIEGGFPWNRLRSDRPLVYCSLGSQSHLLRQTKSILKIVTEAVSLRNDWQLVIATGDHIAPSEICGRSENVLTVRHAPQLQILARTQFMITHGGFNTVKECIFFAIPMLIFPLIRDHPAVAARVVHHGLGLRGQLGQFSVGMIRSMASRITREGDFHDKCRIMQAIFRKREAEERGVAVVLASASGRCAFPTTTVS
jgi:zeaxanthin glucosyltransferase